MSSSQQNALYSQPLVWDSTMEEDGLLSLDAEGIQGYNAGRLLIRRFAIRG